MHLGFRHCCIMHSELIPHLTAHENKLHYFSISNFSLLNETLQLLAKCMWTLTDAFPFVCHTNGSAEQARGSP